MRELTELLRWVADSGIEFEDSRIGYVTVQLDADLWHALRHYRTHP